MKTLFSNNRLRVLLFVAFLLVGFQLVVSPITLSSTLAANPHSSNVGDIIVTDHVGSLIRIDPTTGQQSIISQGGMLGGDYGVAVNPDGQIFVSGSVGLTSVIVQVDPATGAQSLISKGGYLNWPKSLTFDNNDQLLVTDIAGVIRVDPLTGVQTLVSSTTTSEPWGLAVVPQRGKGKK